MNIGIELKNAFYISLAMLIWRCIEFFTGIQTTYIAYYSLINNLSLIIFVFFLYKGIKTRRNEFFEGYIDFTNAFKSGFLISFFSAIFSIPVVFIFYKFINTGFFDFMIEYSAIEAATKGKDPDQVTQLAKSYFTMKVFIIQAFTLSLLSGSLVSMILAAILKRKAPEEVLHQEV
jgi:hypothetical protein